jgi:hypothetical protein
MGRITIIQQFIKIFDDLEDGEDDKEEEKDKNRVPAGFEPDLLSFPEPGNAPGNLGSAHGYGWHTSLYCSSVKF